ncbi:MAG: leucine-rich repeat protein [Oscillospiraceae bacterium]|nr:leucine-rich repeat protein [Oscillospiraceae bacterium]
MNKMKRIASAVLSLAILTGTAGSGATALLDANLTASAATYDTVNSVMADWQNRINAEKQKYPEKKNGKQCYWNSEYNEITGKYGTPDTYSTTPCTHDMNGAGLHCNFITPTVRNYSPSNYGRMEIVNLQYNYTLPYGQCIGFASKVAEDMWGTKDFVQYRVEDEKLVFNGKPTENFEPKVGDNVRFWNHSIFITGISGDQIYFVQCNGDGKCGIDWDATYYHQYRITKQFLREEAEYIERVAVAGDLNLNGRIDNGDAAIFEDTIMYDGITRGTELATSRVAEKPGAPLSAYDVNADGYVDMNDINQIRYGQNHPDYQKIVRLEDAPGCRWSRCGRRSGYFRFTDGSFYIKNNLGGVSWIGNVDRDLTSYTVPSRVYNAEENKWYDVTEIGESAYMWRTCTGNLKYKTFKIPDTVKRIHSYALEGWTDLTSFGFSGSNPQLETIDNYAFYNCSKNVVFDLRKAKKLANIGDSAFEGCTKISYIDLPFFTDHALYFGSTTKGSIFGANYPKNVTLFVNNPNSTNQASNYQHLKFKNGDINYWSNGKLKLHGRLFKVYQGEQYICQKGINTGYLNPPQ